MNLNRLDLNKIAVFSQVMEAGNYQRAAEVLHLTPSALSQSIASLEASLGIQLFNRIGKRLTPTQAGLNIHQEFRQHHGEFLKSLLNIKGAPDEVTGVLRIGAYLEFAKSHLSPWIKKFLEEYPDTQIKMVFDTPTRLHTGLMRGSFDLCFSIFPSHETKVIHSDKIYQQELVLIAPTRMLGSTPTFEQLMKVPMIEYYYNHQPIRRWLNLHFQKRPKKIPVRAFASTAEMVLSLVREGTGVGIVPYYLTESPEILRDIRVIRPTRKRLDDHIWLLEKQASSQSTIKQCFLELISNLKTESLY